ncbi:class I SAM-dependent methyltransferase [Bernardetia sp. ABR2-2B]|uniref:class I SAM-dependent methyltransferase n=1 Tax=Bernardetia sp. ABR2-2B TaxID=3127472 RepID=UPI0030D433EF
MYSEKFRSTILEGLSKEQIPQEILYLNKGATNYYQAYGQGKTVSQTSKESFSHSKLNYLAFVEHIITKTKLQNPRINLISLGCGNGFQEKELLRTLVKSGYTVSYFGVDNSEAMLQLAKENLNEIDVIQNFICADFCLEQEKIKESIEPFFASKSINLSMLMGKTISNFEPSSLLSALHKLLVTSYQKNNFLWLELFGRQTENLSIQHKKVSFSVLDALQKRYSAYLENIFMQKFYLNPLQELGIKNERKKNMTQRFLKLPLSLKKKKAS